MEQQDQKFNEAVQAAVPAQESTNQPSTPPLKEEKKGKGEKKKKNVVRSKMRQNKLFFYGFPILVLACVFGGLVYFILPCVQVVLNSGSKNQILDKNTEVVDRSVQNLKAAYNDENVIKGYDLALTEFIPENPKVGDVINVIQTKAKDFNLESQIGVTKNDSKTTIDKLAKKNQDDKPLFQSITSGEIGFQPKSLNKNTDAVLISIEVSLKGDRKSFLSFVQGIQGIKPLINLVSVEYSESKDNVENPDVNGLVRFEAYALKLDTNSAKVEQSKPLTKDDNALFQEMREERFLWNKAIGEKIENLSVTPTPSE